MQEVPGSDPGQAPKFYKLVPIILLGPAGVRLVNDIPSVCSCLLKRVPTSTSVSGQPLHLKTTLFERSFRRGTKYNSCFLLTVYITILSLLFALFELNIVF
jgi:hypothetical protein